MNSGFKSFKLEHKLKQFRNFQLFFKYLLSYMVLLIIPVMGLSFLVSNFFLTAFEREVVSNSMNILAHVQNSIDTSIKELHTISYQIYNNSKLTTYKIQNNALDTREGINELKNYTIGHDFIKEVCVYYPKLKDVVKYMHELYAEGLISSESFTDDMATTDSKMKSNPPITGFISLFNNPFVTDDIWKPMLPLKSPNVDKPMVRQQTSRVARHYFSIFSKNKYPEASMRLADILAEEEWSLQSKFGFIGEHLLKTEDGKYKVAPGVKDADYLINAPGNFICAALTRDVCNKFIWDGQRGLRQKAYDELYKPIIAPIENFYPPVVFTEEQTDRKAELQTDIFGYAAETIAHWIIDGGIDEEWDAYVKKMNDMGVEELVQIYQEALDIFNQ